MESLLVLLLIANLAGLFLIWQRQDKQEKHLSKSLEDQADHLSDQLDYRFEQARQASQLDQKDLEVAVSDRLQEVRMELHQGLTQVRQEMTDNLNTVVYHGRLDVHEHSLPVFIVVDDSAFTYVRIAITTTSIDKKVIPAVLKELNTLNQDYKVSKYYVSVEDNNIYMDVSMPCLNEQFDPTVVVNLLLEVIQPHLDAVHKDILKVAGLA